MAALEILSATISAATVSDVNNQARTDADGVEVTRPGEQGAMSSGFPNGTGHEGYPNVVFDFEDMSWLNNIP